MVSPYAAGGGIGLLARRLEQRLGRPFVVENKAGAATAIAASLVAQAAPDAIALDRRADLMRRIDADWPPAGCSPTWCPIGWSIALLIG